MLDAIRTLYAYNAWANARIVDGAARLDPDQLRAEGSGFGSFHDTLVHLVSAQWLWLQRWRGVAGERLWDPADFPDVAAIYARWRDVEGQLALFVAALTEEDLARVVSYVNAKGETWAYPLWQQMLHVANHGTQHRSELAALLTRFGSSPGWLDLLIYLDEAGLVERR